MELLRSKKLLLAIGVLLVAIVLAYKLGLEAADYVSERRRQTSRQRSTSRILEQMQTIAVGDTLPDHDLVDSYHREVRLSSVIQGESLIIFIDDQCSYCYEELETLLSLDSGGTLLDRVILISSHQSEYPDQDMADRLFGVILLIDRKNAYRNALKIYTQPFNIVVDGSLSILKIIPTKLSEQEVSEMFQ